MSNKIPCLKISRPDTHGNMWCLVRMRGYQIQDEFDGAEVGETIRIEYCEMTESELEALPEFTGW